MKSGSRALVRALLGVNGRDACLIRVVIQLEYPRFVFWNAVVRQRGREKCAEIAGSKRRRWGLQQLMMMGTRRVSKRFIVFTPQGYINDNARDTRDSEAA